MESKHSDNVEESMTVDKEIELDLLEQQLGGAPNPQDPMHHQPKQLVELRQFSGSNKGQPPECLIEVVNQISNEQQDPKNYQEAVTGAESEEWIKAINEEIQSLNKNNTWTLTTLPERKTAVGSKWV